MISRNVLCDLTIIYFNCAAITKFNIKRRVFFLILYLALTTRTINPLMHNVPKWSSSICYKIFKVCLTILGCYALTLSWRRSLSYRNYSIDPQSKSMDWCRYYGDLRHERVKELKLLIISVDDAFLVSECFEHIRKVSAKTGCRCCISRCGEYVELSRQ